MRIRIRNPRSVLASVACAVFLAACSSDSPTVPEIGASLQDTPPAQVLLCKLGEDGTVVDFTAGVAPATGSLPQGNAFELTASSILGVNPECRTVWRAASPLDPEGVLTISEVQAPGVQIDLIVVVGGLDPQTVLVGPGDPTNSVSLRVSGDFGSSATVIFKNSGVPEENGACVGLTPGYWKNWRNHYTAGQFESLLLGTIAGSIAEADAIFAAKPRGGDMIVKLRHFILANQLTLNLTGTDLPNPSGGSLSSLCVSPAFDVDLAAALTAALDMHENPGDYSKGEIEDIKDILDDIANMGEQTGQQ